MEEIWIDVKGYEGLYLVSSRGRIKSLISQSKKRDHIMKPGKGGKKNNDYFTVTLTKNKIRRSIRVHRLVLMSFNRMPSSHEECNHIDRNRFNNYINNLEWCTHSENILHSRDSISKAKKGKTQGEKNHRSIVGDHQALHIKTMWFIQNATIKEIQKFYDLKYNTIYRIIHHRYKHLDYLIVPCTEEEVFYHEKKNF